MAARERADPSSASRRSIPVVMKRSMTPFGVDDPERRVAGADEGSNRSTITWRTSSTERSSAIARVALSNASRTPDSEGLSWIPLTRPP